MSKPDVVLNNCNINEKLSSIAQTAKSIKKALLIDKYRYKDAIKNLDELITKCQKGGKKDRN